MFYESLIRPLLFKLDAEQVHNLTLSALSAAGRFGRAPSLYR